MMSEMFDYLNRILTQLGSETGLAAYNTDLRMADYGKMLALTCELDGMSFPLVEDFVKKMQAYTMSENDPIFMALRAAAQNGPEGGWYLRAKQLYEKCKQYAPNREFEKRYKNATLFGRSLKAYANGGQLPHYGIDVRASKSGSSFKYRLVRLAGVQGLDEIFSDTEDEEE